MRRFGIDGFDIIMLCLIALLVVAIVIATVAMLVLVVQDTTSTTPTFLRFTAYCDNTLGIGMWADADRGVRMTETEYMRYCARPSE